MLGQDVEEEEEAWVMKTGILCFSSFMSPVLTILGTGFCLLQLFIFPSTSIQLVSLRDEVAISPALRELTN